MVSTYGASPSSGKEGSDTRKSALLATGIQASRSPALHEEKRDSQGPSYQYQPIDLTISGLGVDAQPDLPRSAERMGFAGLNYLLRCSRKSATAPVNGCRNWPIMPPGTGLMVPYFTGQRSAGRWQVPNSRSHSGVWAV